MATELEQIDDHFEQSLVKFVAPFWGKPRMAALLQSFVARVQELEDATFEVLAAFNIDTADAARLAVLGRIAGQTNYGWSTETYRSVIRAKIRANRSRSTEDDIVDVIRLAMGSEGRIFLQHMVPATCWVWLTDGVDDDHLEALQFLLPKTRAAGVQLQLFWTEDGLDTAGIFDTSTFDDGSVFWDVSVL
jgi:hypothetical protein